jgi:exopolysaccharide biosynthesis polyprenyl glycosylphosphotransferase
MAVIRRDWEIRYSRKLIWTDISVIFFAVIFAQLLRYGPQAVNDEIQVFNDVDIVVTYSALSVVLILTWLMMLVAFDTRKSHLLGIGAEEYKQVATATFGTFGTFGILAFLFDTHIGRGYLLLALPTGLLLLLLSRWLWRKRLHQQRARHRNLYRVLLVGDREKSKHVAREISRNQNAGFELVGAIVEKQNGQNLLPGIPVVGEISSMLKTIDELQIDTLIMTSSDAISLPDMQKLGWELEARNIDLIVSAALTDIAGPRIHTRQVSGLPLIHVEFPEFTGLRKFSKRIFDLLGATILIVILSPILLIVALLVKFTSPGKIFYAQQRVGIAGSTFPMFKFRSMVENADDQLQSLLDLQGTSGLPLHKIENDPRITSVGKFIRRYSLDELPQLVNVLIGNMSLVGPRPQRESEVAFYDPHHHRRLLKKPGITGLWQVSGRSSLSWEESIRLDLYYVENWSLMGDFVILFRTIKAVLRANGAQ